MSPNILSLRDAPIDELRAELAALLAPPTPSAWAEVTSRPTSAERIRRHCERRRRGERSIAFDIRDREIEWLVSKGFVVQAKVADAQAVCHALGKLLDKVMVR